MVFFEEKTVGGAWPRGPASAKTFADRFRIAYLKYTAPPQSADLTTVNLIFSHGAGMTKRVWVPLIEDLLERNRAQRNWRIGAIVALDAAVSGDSGRMNKDVLAWGYDWRDGAKDLVAVVKHEIAATGDFVPSARARNVVIGHSMGGFIATYAAFLEPSLFDSCVAMEPVMYYSDDVHDFFVARLAKLDRVLADEWATREDAERYFREGSVWKTMHPRVLAAFMADELYTEHGRWKTKTSKQAQLSSYYSAMHCVAPGQKVLPMLEVPYLYASGTEAMWNHPDQGPWVAEHVPKGLLEMTQLEGDHMVPFANLRDTLELVYGYIDRRVAFVEAHRHEFPEERFKQDPQNMLSTMYKYMSKGDRHSAFWYGKPQVISRDGKL